ncbi:hypothetical protein [Coraliomargarita akajimensis]|nr:hypothetical protein [Coraliomargarita akajimensis]
MIHNRIQRACVDHGDLYSNSQTVKKHSFAVTEVDIAKEDKAVYLEIYASTGGLGLLSLVNFALLTGTLLWVHTQDTSKA